MPVTVPPRSTDTDDDRDLRRRVADLELLIEEARRRARPRVHMYTVGVDPSRPSTIHLAGASQTGDGPRILRSTNDGRTWVEAP